MVDSRCLYRRKRFLRFVMYTDRGHSPGDYPRVCDFCGHRWMFKQLVQKEPLRFACPDCAPGLTANQISRYNAKARPLRIRPRKHARDYIQTPIFQFSEAAIFNFVAEVAPKGERDGSDDILAAAWAAIYMADIISQGKRPLGWDRTARAVMSECLTYLLSLQLDSTRAWGGAISSDQVTTNTSVTLAAGVAFMKAYAITGTPAYLLAADNIAGHVRKIQCADLKTFMPTVYPGTTSPYRVGGLPKSVVADDDAETSREYLIADVMALWFLDLLQDVRGANKVYGSGAAGYATDPAGTIATMISELTTFVTSGAVVSGSGTLVPGLSATNPKIKYLAAQSGGIDSAEWEFPDDGITVVDLALALRGLHESGVGASQVTAMMAMLASSPSSPAHETPAGATAEAVLAGVSGTYDATLCPATVIHESSPFTNESSLYDWASMGLLSPILAATPTTFKTSKETLSTARRLSTVSTIASKFIGPDGLSGLSLQPIRPTTAGTYDNSVTRAARTGMAYRQSPGRYPSLRGS